MWMAVVKIVNSKIVRHLDDFAKEIKCGLEVDGKFVDIGLLKQRDIKQLLLIKKYSSLKYPDFKYKIKAEIYYGHIAEEDWSQIFMLPRTLPVDNKMRELQYKIIMRYIPTNYLLHKMRIVNSQLCTFCNLYPETIDHLFFYCTEVKSTWLYVLSKFQAVTSRNICPTMKQFVLGLYKDNQDDLTKSLNVIILFMKQYIMSCRYENNSITPQGFINLCRSKVLLYKTLLGQKIYTILSHVFEVNDV